MIKIIFDWLIVTPAQFVAVILTFALACGPLLAGPLIGFAVYKLMDPNRPQGNWSPRKFWPLVTAWVAGIYATLVLGFAFFELPKAIFRFLKDD